MGSEDRPLDVENNLRVILRTDDKDLREAADAQGGKGTQRFGF